MVGSPLFYIISFRLAPSISHIFHYQKVKLVAFFSLKSCLFTEYRPI